MSAKHFVDTNILVYAHDAAAGDKHARARALVEQLWADRSGVLSTQVLQEFYVNIRKKARAPLAAAEARQWIADYLDWEVVVNDGQSVLEAIELEERYEISFWDALIVQAANSGGATVLYSEDLSHGQHYSNVTVENPLLASA
jgi:predicted nucleic acid-binding protein